MVYVFISYHYQVCNKEVRDGCTIFNFLFEMFQSAVQGEEHTFSVWSSPWSLDTYSANQNVPGITERGSKSLCPQTLAIWPFIKEIKCS
jgi:hypothetical protein